jgi:nucleoid DNA-binding protein
MNNKLLLQDLTDRLAEAGNLKKKEADEFLRAFFKTAEEALFQGEIVKINGFGSFKLMLVEARKSVNVSTGEEFEIKEHYKISFIPDNDLKTAVNKPYSHLEPVELSSGIEPTPLAVEKKALHVQEKPSKTVNVPEKKNKPEVTSKKMEKKKRTKGDVTPRTPKKFTPKRSTLMWILFFLVIAALGIWSWLSNDARRKEDAFKIREMEMIDSLEADATLQEDLAVIQTEIASDSSGTVSNPKSAVKPESKAPIAQPTIPIAKPIAQPAVPIAKPIAKPAVPAAKPAIKTAQVVKTKTVTSTIKPAVAPPTPAKQVFIATETLGPGNRLTLLALKYYGHKAFWVYIYQANKKSIQNPDDIPVGTTINIPKPDPKLIDSNNPALVAKAKALQYQILGH